jgi:predicted esterase
MQQHNITVTKTARFFTEGNPDASEVWILLHGYGMLASKMITYFSELEKKEIFIIAPEGLSRFYWKGFQGDVVASWMTKEDRQDEIVDYINYLNKLFIELKLENKKINILGFSQGVATSSRWLSQVNFNINKLVFWAGEPAYDIDYSYLKNVPNLYYVYGNQDLFIQEGQILKIQNQFNPYLFEYINFDGKHELNTIVLTKLIKA